MIKPVSSAIVFNKKICEGHYVIRLKSPQISRTALPGQFVQMLVSGLQEPLLPRPFSFLDVKGSTLDILYQVVGSGTEMLSHKKKGESLVLLGPLGNGWNTRRLSPVSSNLILVGGGVGIPPLYHLAKDLYARHGKKVKKNITVFLGGRDKKLLHCEKDFKKMGVEVRLSTDDGSKGHKGLVTEILDEYLERSTAPSATIFTCGPTPMLKAVSILSEKYDVDCQVSVEEPMPCGFGVCLGCAIKVKLPDHQYRYAMSCTEGPVFEAKDIVWD